MFTPWNLNRSAVRLSDGILAVPPGQNLCQERDVILLGFTPWNSCSACRACLVGCKAYSTRIVTSDRIAEDWLNLFDRGDAIPLGFVPWNATLYT